jgi:branched-chain amino acid transport system ATP-binding protein
MTSLGRRWPRMSRLRSPRTLAGLACLLAALIILAFLPTFLSRYQVLVLFEIFEFFALAQAWNLLAGYGGMVSLAPAAAVGLGGYAAAVVGIHVGLPLPFLPLAGGIAAALFAALVSVPMFRFRGLYFVIATLVLAEALGVFMVNWNGLGGATGLFLTEYAPTIRTLYYYCLVLAVFGSAIVFFVLHTRLGLSLRALRDDEDTAQEMGVSTFRTKLWAFVVSSFLIGLVGGLNAARIGTIEPYGAFSLVWTINIVSTTIVGGIGTIVGPLVGSGFTVLVGEALSRYTEIHVAIIGAIVILVIRFAPFGIWGVLTAGANRIRELANWPRASESVLQGAAIAETARPPDQLPSQSVTREPPIRTRTQEDDPPPSASATPGASPGRVLLAAKGITKRFGDVVAVSGVSLDLHAGEVLGIIGPNGAGKSTFVGLLNGAFHSDSGAVEFEGTDITRMPSFKRARLGIGRTHQIPKPFRRMTVLENLLVARSYGGASHHEGDIRSDCEEILADLGLKEVAGVRAENLTLLQLKRLELARALALEPRILLMDEIGAGLVEAELAELIALIKQIRHRLEAIIIIEHIMDVIQQCCDRVAVLDGGRLIADGSVRQVLTAPEVISCYLGTGWGKSDADARAVEARAIGEPMLVVDNVSANYGHFRALSQVSFTVGRGEVVALLGTNGAGKTTVARAVSGMLPVASGRIDFCGQRVSGRPAHEIARLGLAHCMEGRHIFADLSVHENLLVAALSAGGKTNIEARLDRVYSLFPVLAERRNRSGAQLSGGQQQMLAIGRALIAEPKLIVFDEISLGLAPTTVDKLYDTLVQVRDAGMSMIVIEQNVERGLALADRVFVMEKGTIALGGTPAEVRGDSRLEALYMGELKRVAAE